MSLFGEQSSSKPRRMSCSSSDSVARVLSTHPLRLTSGLLRGCTRPAGIRWFTVYLGVRNFQTSPQHRSMRAYVLVELGDSEAIDLFLREEVAQAALEDALNDEPGWAGTLTVEPIELDERAVSAN